MRKRKHSLFPLITDMLLLFLALACVAFSVCTAYALEADYDLLLAGAAVLAVVIPLLLSLPRFQLPLTLAALAWWGWAVWTAWEPLSWGGTAIRCGIVNTIAQKIPGVTAIMPIIELPDATWTWLITLWLLTAEVVYTLALGLCLRKLRRALPVVLLTLLPILPALCVTEAPAPLPMAGLLAVWGTLLLPSLAAKRDPAGSARLRPMAFVASALALAVLLQNLPTSGTTQPLWAADLRAGAITAVQRMDLSSLTSHLGLEFWKGSGSTEYVNLTTGGASRTGRTALRVETDTPGKYFLRGWSADVYSGSRWAPLDREAKKELEELLQAPAEQTEDADQASLEPLLLLGESIHTLGSIRWGFSSIYAPVEDEETATMKVENVSAPGSCVYYPYILAEIPEGAEADNSHLARDRGWEHEITFYPYREDVLYGTLARQYSVVRDDAYQDFVYAHYLQLPEETRQMLLDWLIRHDADEMMLGGVRSPEDYAKLVKWATTGANSYYKEGESYPFPAQATQVTEEEVEALRGAYAANLILSMPYLLRTAASYNADTPAPPAGEDYVNWFLNESREGYCMHFATTATLLFRVLGIPARYVSGYVVDVPKSGKAVVPDSAAHAWVEVYVDGVGWYPVEVTPGFEGDGTGENEPSDFGDDGDTAAPAVTAEATAGPAASAAPSAAPTQAPQDLEEQEVRQADMALHSVLFLIALVALAALAWVLFQKRQRNRLAGPDPNAAVVWAYACRRALGPWGGEDSDELTTLAGKARFSPHTLTQEERDRAATLFTEEARRVYDALPWWKKPLFFLRWGKVT